MLLRPLQDPAQHRLEVFGYPVQNDRDGLQVHGNQRDNEGHNDPRDAQAMSDPDGATVAVEEEADEPEKNRRTDRDGENVAGGSLQSATARHVKRRQRSPRQPSHEPYKQRVENEDERAHGPEES